ncbi:hypothetical protein GQX74_011684 [Glossina fuscipes]|nr:hypothetical protein GQX74_011684 [Glossina fuscipes]
MIMHECVGGSGLNYIIAHLLFLVTAIPSPIGRGVSLNCLSDSSVSKQQVFCVFRHVSLSMSSVTVSDVETPDSISNPKVTSTLSPWVSVISFLLELIGIGGGVRSRLRPLPKKKNDELLAGSEPTVTFKLLLVVSNSESMRLALPGVEVAEGDKDFVFRCSGCNLLGETSITRGSISETSAEEVPSSSLATNTIVVGFSILLTVPDFCGVFSTPALVDAAVFTLFVVGVATLWSSLLFGVETIVHALQQQLRSSSNFICAN